jgi:hypothetical protein
VARGKRGGRLRLLLVITRLKHYEETMERTNVALTTLMTLRILRLDNLAPRQGYLW